MGYWKGCCKKRGRLAVEKGKGCYMGERKGCCKKRARVAVGNLNQALLVGEIVISHTNLLLLKTHNFTARMHQNAQICTIFSKFSRGSMPPDPPRWACLLRRHALVASPLRRVPKMSLSTPPSQTLDPAL